MPSNWFEVDRKGLAKLVEQRGKGRLIAELIQNAWDEPITGVSLSLVLVGPGEAQITVTDDAPSGFRNLIDAYTLFAESYKKADPTKRGRFNLGEKLVLAFCKWAQITSTKGSVAFTKNGRERTTKVCRAAGTEFLAKMPMKKAEYNEVLNYLQQLIPPSGICTTINGLELPHRTPIHVFKAALPTVVAGGDGRLRPTLRKVEIELFDPREDEVASIYELGLPVVEIEDRWHLNVQQKVPLNMGRDNVTPAYLRGLRTCVLNEMHQELTRDDSTEDWVREAASDSRCSDEAIKTVVEKRFGENRVSFDPRDREANRRAASQGYAVIGGGSLSAGEWENVRQAKAVSPAGRIFPTPQPRPGEEDVLPPEQWTEGMRRVADYTMTLHRELFKCEIAVHMVKGKIGFDASIGHGRLRFFIDVVGRKWFDNQPDETLDKLLIHEFGHSDGGGDHLSDWYHRALCTVGAKLKALALDKPELFLAKRGP